MFVTLDVTRCHFEKHWFKQYLFDISQQNANTYNTGRSLCNSIKLELRLYFFLSAQIAQLPGNLNSIG